MAGTSPSCPCVTGAVVEEREQLREQLRAAPAEGDPTATALSVAKVRDLEARLLEEREEKAALSDEVAALNARLAKLKDAGTDELREKAELQDALVRCEEQRLEVSRALIDFQLEVNDAKQEWANTRFTLEQRILELESGRLEHHVRAEDHAALRDERDALAARLREAADTEARGRAALEAEKATSSAAQSEVKRLGQLLAALEAASAGDARALLLDDEDDAAAAGGGADGIVSYSGGGGGGGSGIAAAAGSSGVNLREVRLQLQRQLRGAERRSAELESRLAELQQQLEVAQRSRCVTQEALDQARTLFKRRMEGAARDVADLVQRANLMAGCSGPSNEPLSLSADELMSRIVTYMNDVAKAASESITEARRDADELSGRHATLRRRLRGLYAGYRTLRYRLQDEWPSGGAPPRVPHEDAVLGGTLDDIIRADDQLDRQALLHAQSRIAALEGSLAALKVRALEWDTLGTTGSAGRLANTLQTSSDRCSQGVTAHNAAQQQQQQGAGTALALENAALREELDRLKRRLPALGLLRRSGSSIGAGGQSASSAAAAASAAAVEQLASQLAQARAENQQLRAAGTVKVPTESPMTSVVSSTAQDGGRAAGAAALQRQLQEFTQGTQLELERRLRTYESRAVMAEEQLAVLQRHLASINVAYQREIARLRTALAAVNPQALSGMPPLLPDT